MSEPTMATYTRPPLGWAHAASHLLFAALVLFFAGGEGDFWPWGVLFLVLVHFSYFMGNGLAAIASETRAVRHILQEKNN